MSDRLITRNPLRWTEMVLKGTQSLRFPDGSEVELDLLRWEECHGCLRVRYLSGGELILTGGDNCGAYSNGCSVFLFAGTDETEMLLFGGEKGLYLTSYEQIAGELPIHREWELRDFWSTNIVDAEGLAVIVYEGGVLAIDDSLRPVWHKQKHIHDHFLGVDHGILRLRRDAPLPPGWRGTSRDLLERRIMIDVRIGDGALLSDLACRSIDDLRAP